LSKIEREEHELEQKEHELTITIVTTQGKWEGAVFPKAAKIEDVIRAVVTHFGFAANGNYELRLESDPDKTLKPERTLISYGIKDGTILRFVDLGGDTLARMFKIIREAFDPGITVAPKTSGCVVGAVGLKCSCK
jgi:hypothetical protein